MWIVQQYYRKERDFIRAGGFLWLAQSRVKKAHRVVEPAVYNAAIWEKSNDIHMYKCVNSWRKIISRALEVQNIIEQKYIVKNELSLHD